MEVRLTGIFLILTLMLAIAAWSAPAQPVVNWFRADGSVNWEAEKQQLGIPTDTIVVHHYALKGRVEDVTPESHSALEYERIYKATWPSLSSDPDVRNLPIQSGHIRDGKQVYYTYHCLIFPDGLIIHLLNDDLEHPERFEVGWHCANWDINNRSLAICIVDDLEHKGPTLAALEALARLVREYVERFKKAGVPEDQVKIYGHNDVKKGGPTSCPGSWFFLGGRAGVIKQAGVNLREPAALFPGNLAQMLRMSHLSAAEFAPLLGQADEKVDQETQLLKGEPFQVERIENGWAYGRALHYSHAPGWVKADTLAPQRDPAYRWPAQAVAKDPLALARTWIGTPYDWGGMRPIQGIDCSGLVHMAYRLCGKLIPRDSQDQEAAGQEVAWEDLRPGDLITYGKVGAKPTEGEAIHIAFYTGEDKILHATWREDDKTMRVIEEPEPADLKTRRRKAIRFRLN